MARGAETPDLERQVQLLLEQGARRDAEMEALRAEIALLRAPAPPPLTEIEADYRRWAALSAREKSQLAADRLHPPDASTRPFAVQLLYHPRRSPTGQVEAPPSDFPRLSINAHSDPEARAFYQTLCGIQSFDNQVTYLECQLAG